MSRFQWFRKKSKAEEGPQDAPQEPAAETPQDKAGLFRKKTNRIAKTGEATRSG